MANNGNNQITTNAPATNGIGPMPLFYVSPRPLSGATDGKLRISPPKNFMFAAKTNAIPLLSAELAVAAAWYPTVFTATDTPIPAAVVGLKNDSNLFVDAEGQWKQGGYLPAYLRRYPFILMETPEDNQMVLCIDSACETLGDTGEFALFEGEQPSKFTRDVMDFCGSLRHHGEETEKFVAALREYDLLVPNDAVIEMPGGAKMQMGGFLVISQAKFDTLPDNIYLAWRRQGWIALIYAHLGSMHRWQALATMAMMEQAPPAA